MNIYYLKLLLKSQLIIFEKQVSNHTSISCYICELILLSKYYILSSHFK